VAERGRIIAKPLEHVTAADLPDRIDLIVTETVSSLILGFGSWDAIEILTDRLSETGTMIPCRGRLLGFLSEHDYATRSNRNSGIKFLKKGNIDADLFFRTFRSGGNVFDKSVLNYELSLGAHRVFEVLNFDYRRRPLFDLSGETVVLDSPARYQGLTVYWELTLSEEMPAVTLCSHDPNLTAWYPFYIPFDQPIECRAGQSIRPTIRPLPINAPYTYAFQVMDGDRPLTNILYW